MTCERPTRCGLCFTEVPQTLALREGQAQREDDEEDEDDEEEEDDDDQQQRIK